MTSQHVTSLAPRVLNVADAAKYLGVSARTMYRLSAQNGTGYQELPVVHVAAGRRVFLVADLDAYLERQRSTVARPVLRPTA